MFVILMIFSTTALTSALEPAENVEANEKIKNIINKYLTKIPDIEEQYIVDEGLSRAISHFFKGKISSFPLYRISLKIDRNPVKIPWTLGDAKIEAKIKTQNLENKSEHVEKQYEFQKRVSGQDVRNIELVGDPDVGKNKGTSKLSEAPDKIINKLPSKKTKIVKYGTVESSEQPDKTKNLDTSKLTDEPDKPKNIEKLPEEPDRSTDKLSAEPNKSSFDTDSPMVTESTI